MLSSTVGQRNRAHGGAIDSIFEGSQDIRGQHRCSVHGSNDGSGIRGIAIGIHKVAGGEGEIFGLRPIAVAEPNACGDDASVEDGVVCSRVLDAPALRDGLKYLFRLLACIGHGDDHIEALTIGRQWRDEACGLANDLMRVGLDKTETDHAGDEDCAVCAFGIAIYVSQAAGLPAATLGMAGDSVP